MRARTEYRYINGLIPLKSMNYADWINGPTYRLKEDRADRNETRLELGVDVLTKEGLRIGADFDSTVSAHTDSQGLRLSLGTAF